MCIEVATNDVDTFVDVVVGVGDDAFLVVHGTVVVDADDSIDEVGAAFRRGVAHGEVEDGVAVVVAAHGKTGAVVFGHCHGIQVFNKNLLSDVVVFESPSFVDDEFAERGDDSLVDRNI